jgi:hypothetical protein
VGKRDLRLSCSGDESIAFRCSTIREIFFGKTIIIIWTPITKSYIFYSKRNFLAQAVGQAARATEERRLGFTRRDRFLPQQMQVIGEDRACKK